MDNLKHFIQMIYKNTHTLSHTEATFIVPPIQSDKALGTVAQRWSGNKKAFSHSSLLHRKRPWNGWLQRNLAGIGERGEMGLGKNV